MSGYIGGGDFNGGGGEPIGPAGGDLSGTYPNPTVVDINGAAVPVAGALTTGNVLKVNGASALTYGAVNLAGGANHVTGVLPSANVASHAGDVTGTHAASVVARINGATVPAAGALTTNHVLKVSGVSATTYGFIVNANVDAAAAIAYSKLSLSNSIVNADISASAAIAYSKLSLSNSIVNADISTTAAIAGSKINPNFGTQSISTTNTISVGSTVAGSGSIRVPNNVTALAARNSTNDADVPLITINGSNVVLIGDAVNDAGLTLRSSGTVTVASDSGSVDLANMTVTTETPLAGAAQELPTTPEGYLTIKINGVDRKIAFY